jgi:hypothetical protein
MLEAGPPEGAAATTIEQLAVVDPVDESFTFAVNVNVPAANGVPLIAPVEALSVRPPGNAPPAIEYVYPGNPPPPTRADL